MPKWNLKGMLGMHDVLPTRWNAHFSKAKNRKSCILKHLFYFVVKKETTNFTLYTNIANSNTGKVNWDLQWIIGLPSVVFAVVISVVAATRTETLVVN